MRTILIGIFLALISFPAEAHRPYLIKERTISGPQGEMLIVEKLYGDGIFTADPVSLQIRNAATSSVLAYSQTGTHVFVFCPIIEFCWAFPYEIFSPFSIGRKLDYKTINWDAPTEKLALEKDEAETYAKYLADPHHKKAYSWSFGDPETNGKEEGFNPHILSVLISPLLIALDQIIPLGSAAILTSLLVLLYWLFFQRFQPEKRFNTVLLRGSGILIIFAHLTIYLVAMVLLGFTLSTPWLYMAGAVIIGAKVTSRFTRRWHKKDPGYTGV